MAYNNSSKAELILMTDKHKGIITQNFDVLTSNLTAEAVLNNLVSESVLSMPDLDGLLQERVAHKRAGALLQLLIKREDRTFYVLIKACQKYNMGHLANILKDGDAKDVEEEELNDEKEEVKDEGDETDAVVISHKSKQYEVELEEDGTILISTIGQVLERGYSVRGLQYDNPATGRSRLVRLKEGKLYRPKNGWSTIVYSVLADKDPGSIGDTSAEALEQVDGGMSELTPMTDAHVRILNDKRTILVNSMDPVVMSSLRSLGVINLREEEDIRNGRGQSAQIEALLDKLQKKDDSAFEKLVIALQKEDQAFLARELQHPKCSESLKE